MKKERVPESVILHRLLAILNASYRGSSTISGDTLFVDANLGLADNRVLCEKLSESLGIPDIPSNYFRQIPTTMEIQDYGPKNRSANHRLTIRQLAGKIASWLAKKHPKVQLGTPQSL